MKRRRAKGTPSARERRQLLAGALAAVLALSGTVGVDALQQEEVLVGLYNATGGPQGLWRNDSGWRGAYAGDGDTLSTCRWYGVVCTSSSGLSGNVTEIWLRDNGLVGDLDSALTTSGFADLTALEALDLSRNDLSGELSLTLATMDSLKSINLAGNKLTSIPDGWGGNASDPSSGTGDTSATALEHLVLTSNSISGQLPASWLAVQDADASQLLHQRANSSVLSSLRSLLLGNNNLTQSAYQALQSVLTLSAIQTLDLSSNNLYGPIVNCFVLQVCEDWSDCSSTTTWFGGERLSLLRLADNALNESLPSEGLPSSLAVLDMSENAFSGPLPKDYSLLLVLHVDGNSQLSSSSSSSSSSLEVSNSSSTSPATYGNYSCPSIVAAAGVSEGMHLSLDPSYLAFEHCSCSAGQQRSSDSSDCEPCPLGTYRSNAAASNECSACPLGSTTASTGAIGVSECLCPPSTYLSVSLDGSQCAACPAFSNHSWTGAADVSACQCSTGRFLNETVGDSAAVCQECPQGTYKSGEGNAVELCQQCPPGFISTATGATSSSVCVPCPAGAYRPNDASAAICKLCPAGTYSEVEGAVSASLCVDCPAGFYSSQEGAGNRTTTCEACPANTFSSEAGQVSSAACEECDLGFFSDSGSFTCTQEIGNGRKMLMVYLIVGVSTFTCILLFIGIGTKGVVKKDKADVRLLVPYMMARAKHRAVMWAIFFHTLEALDLLIGFALFIYLMDHDLVSGLALVLYCCAVTVGLLLTVYRLYRVIWAQCCLRTVWVEKTHVEKTGKTSITTFSDPNAKRSRQELHPADSQLVVELVKILKHLNVNKFKVQICVVMDIPLTVLNLYILLAVRSSLIENPIFLSSLVIAVFSAGKVSTLIEYHLELRQRKYKLDRLLETEMAAEDASKEPPANVTYTES